MSRDLPRAAVSPALRGLIGTNIRRNSMPTSLPLKSRYIAWQYGHSEDSNTYMTGPFPSAAYGNDSRIDSRLSPPIFIS